MPVWWKGMRVYENMHERHQYQYNITICLQQLWWCCEGKLWMKWKKRVETILIIIIIVTIHILSIYVQGCEGANSWQNALHHGLRFPGVHGPPRFHLGTWCSQNRLQKYPGHDEKNGGKALILLCWVLQLSLGIGFALNPSFVRSTRLFSNWRCQTGARTNKKWFCQTNYLGLQECKSPFLQSSEISLHTFKNEKLSLWFVLFWVTSCVHLLTLF